MNERTVAIDGIWNRRKTFWRRKEWKSSTTGLVQHPEWNNGSESRHAQLSQRSNTNRSKIEFLNRIVSMVLVEQNIRRKYFILTRKSSKRKRKIQSIDRYRDHEIAIGRIHFLVVGCCDRMFRSRRTRYFFVWSKLNCSVRRVVWSIDLLITCVLFLTKKCFYFFQNNLHD